MTASATTITAILDRQDVPARFGQDHELRAIAYSLNRLGNPAEGPEARFYAACSLLPGDTDEAGEYFMENRVLLREIYTVQLSERLDDLEYLEAPDY
jgi:hypothetical protein